MPKMAEVLEGRAHQAEMRAHTPTPGENARLAVTNLLSSILGAPAAERVGSVVENVLDFGPVPAKMATELVQQPVRAGEAVGEALADPSLPNVANAGLQTALTFGPSATLGAAGRSLGAIPKSVTMSGALLGLPFATSSTAGEGSENPLHGLLTDRASKVRQRDEALAEAKRQERTGRGPRWEAAMSEVNKLENELAALDTMIADMQRRNSPEYQMELEQKRKEQEEAELREFQNKPFVERYPTAAAALTYGAPIASGVLAGTAIGKLNRMGRMLAESADKARKAGDMQEFANLANRAHRFQQMAPVAKGAAVAEAALLPAELRAGADFIDKKALPPWSEARKAAEEKMTLENLPNYLSSMGLDVLSGAIGASTGGLMSKVLTRDPKVDLKGVTDYLKGIDTKNLSPDDIAPILYDRARLARESAGAFGPQASAPTQPSLSTALKAGDATPPRSSGASSSTRASSAPSLPAPTSRPMTSTAPNQPSVHHSVLQPRRKDGKWRKGKPRNPAND